MPSFPQKILADFKKIFGLKNVPIFLKNIKAQKNNKIKKMEDVSPPATKNIT